MTQQSESIRRFLDAQFAAQQATEPGPERPHHHPFVTISRQAGAGGHALARAMVAVFAEQDDRDLFGTWQVFDRELCEIVVEDPRLTGALDRLISEVYLSRTEEFFNQLVKPAPDQDYMMEQVFHAVRNLAGIGKVIIVGRGGAHATRGMGPSFSVRLVAPIEARVSRIAELEKLDERRARERVRKLDAHRARVIKRRFGADIDDPLEYDAVWNTGAIGFETMAHATVAVLRRRASDGR